MLFDESNLGVKNLVKLSFLRVDFVMKEKTGRKPLKEKDLKTLTPVGPLAPATNSGQGGGKNSTQHYF